MHIEKIVTKKVSETVSEQLEEMIASGVINPGEKLPSVRELCDQFGVGRSAVRDAITVLKGKGLVTVKQGEGTYVTPFDSSRIFNQNLYFSDPKKVTELFQVRKIVETGMAEMAAGSRSERDLAEMKHILKSQGDSPWEDDYRFHSAIAKATGNPLLMQFVTFISETIKHSMIDFHRFIQSSPETVKTISKHHEQIFESISSGHSSQAKACMLEHLTFVESILHKSLHQNHSS
ncbi:FadR/GntR family transcriptional regulator [Metabacillus indicus]|uniref:FadR/GntR family transcriptional regulator n=1 Tax=Metabacillus indicus TaxID=246786 RepID=UPI0004932A77|nr:FadR/GntR family transcriptional regulator [Metabacillus indicus]KEZ50295.1 hypothetical protein AZ46_0206275 [Metabacillus indicus LMG 22858]